MLTFPIKGYDARLFTTQLPLPVFALLSRRIDDFRRQTRIRTTSLIVTLFGDVVVPHGGRIWLGSLITLLAPLGISERLVRTSVFRLTQEGWLSAQPHGRRANYELTSAGRRRFDEASRHIYASHAPQWDRRWRLLLVVGELTVQERDALRHALFWQGFGRLDAATFIHPSADLSAAFDALVAEGLAALPGKLAPLIAAESHFEFSAGSRELVRRAWDLSTLATDYTAFVAAYLPILAELRRHRGHELAPQEAFLLRLLLIHDYRRLLLRDPELPDVLLPQDWPGQQARLLTRELYRRLFPTSERHLAEHLRLADGSFPPLVPDLPPRFPEDDPLAMISL
ncbi:MAG: phenylacetic acid degradation operon negative regulatory protein PaaX [Rhodocyclaceae bacterium]|nr:phenylacetic acid degradation operon negative regulatory protein PaaX [Rhodocyclaceae bacterium]